MEAIQHIAGEFVLNGAAVSAERFGSGHINASYRVRTEAGGDYLFQRINDRVFPDVAGLTANMLAVTDHLRRRIAAAEGEAGRQRTLTLIPTKQGGHVHVTGQGAYWRAFLFLDGLVAYDTVETPEQAYAGARSFGHFLRFLTDFPAKLLVPVIPDFHNLVYRMGQLESAIRSARGGRAARVRRCGNEVQRMRALAEDLTDIQRALESGRLPLRVTHNDTKFNNVLLTPDGEGRAVIDLDTVMPGVVPFDYGDGIRTVATTAAEDEADLALVGVDEEKYRAFTDGYLSVCRDLLTTEERHFLPRSGPLLALLMAVRFLTGYFEGDTYHTIHYPDHNLDRARNQLHLAELLWRRSSGAFVE